MRTVRWHWRAVAAVAIVVLCEALYRSGGLDSVDVRIRDAWTQWRGKASTPAHVAIVAIDEDTLSAYPDDPMVFWTDRLAVALARLRALGVRAVGVDLLLSISPERWLSTLGGDLKDAARAYDQPFRSELNRGQVVLAATHSGSGARETDYLLPSPDYLLALPDFDLPGFIGLADLSDAGDGVIRRFSITPIAEAARTQAGGGVPTLAFPTLVALRAAGLDPHAATWTLAGRPVTRDDAAPVLPFAGPPGTFPTISLARLLAPATADDAGLQALAGKVVLIGATAPGLNDEHFTPYTTRLFGGRGPLMTGVEIHANAVESLLSGRRVETLATGPRLALLAAVVLLGGLVFARLAPVAGAPVALLLGGGLLVGGYVAFTADVLVPVAVAGVALALVFLATLATRLSGEERARRQLRQMFGRYVSDQVVESLLQSGARPELGGQEQTVTVLFSDIRNFTTISERLDARETVELLNAYFERACVPLLAAGGSIDKFIGDAIMVEFGSPLPVADHAARALRAAIALREVADGFADWVRQRFAGRELPDFAIGIGLHSGVAVIGNIGAPTRMEFTAIGDTVNLASRLEGVTKSLGCVIVASDATVLAAGPGVRCGRTETVHVKGRDAPVRVHEILDLEAAGGPS